MRRFFFPIILVVAAVGLFVVYINPTYQNSKELAVKAASYDDALNKSQQLRAVRDQLLSKRNTFSADDVSKLQEILPDNVDNIRLVIDINNIAARHGLTLANVDIGDVTKNATQNAVASGSSGPVGSVDITFSVNADYETMLAFLQDVEHSLRVIDVQKLSFTSTQSGPSAYTFDIRTYWLH